MPVAIGIINENWLVDKALKRNIADNTINEKAIIKFKLKISLCHSFQIDKVLPRNCNLIIAAPETLHAA